MIVMATFDLPYNFASKRKNIYSYTVITIIHYTVLTKYITAVYTYMQYSKSTGREMSQYLKF